MQVRINLLLLILLCAFSANASDDVAPAPELITGPVPVESRHITNTKEDSTGGLQLPGGLYMVPALTNIPLVNNLSISKKDLNFYRGPDVLSECSFYSTSYLVDGPTTANTCCLIANEINGTSNPCP